MKKAYFILSVLMVFGGFSAGFGQGKTVVSTPKIEVYYFHPTERCPIDQSIEQNLNKLMQNSFAKEIKDGKIKFQVINTDDKSQAKTVARFDINVQALYLLTHKEGKEIKNDFTRFAFDYGQSNPDRFRASLKVEIENALK